MRAGDHPFPHVVGTFSVCDDAWDRTVGWFGGSAAWVPEDGGFHKNHVCSNLRDLLAVGPSLVSASVVDNLAKSVEEWFGERLDPSHVALTAHRMTKGEFVAVHNDMPSNGTETHRVIIHVAAGDVVGGDLVLGRPGGGVMIPPKAGALVSFPLSGHSFHRVEPVVSGTRVTLVYSFWSDAASRPPTKRVPADHQHSAAVVELLERAGAFDRLHRAKHAKAAAREAGRLQSLGAHSLEVADVLVRWGLSGTVVNAGLLHAAYGPIGFSQRLLDRDNRRPARSAAGEPAEELAFLFAALNRSWLGDQNASGDVEARLDDGQRVMVSRGALLAIDLMSWANLSAQAGEIAVNAQMREAATRVINRPSTPDLARHEISRLVLGRD